MALIDHVNLPVSDLDASLAFYTAALRPLGRRLLLRDGNAIGFGIDTWEFGIVLADAPFPAMHVAFTGESRVQVDDFHRAALGHGARSNGAPGLRPQYDPGYYAAFVFDPDGHNVEAVYRGT